MSVLCVHESYFGYGENILEALLIYLFPILRFSSSLLMLGGNLVGTFVGVVFEFDPKLDRLWLGVKLFCRW